MSQAEQSEREVILDGTIDSHIEADDTTVFFANDAIGWNEPGDFAAQMSREGFEEALDVLEDAEHVDEFTNVVADIDGVDVHATMVERKEWAGFESLPMERGAWFLWDELSEIDFEA